MPTRYQVEITRTAEIDVEEIWAYIADDSIVNATRFVIQLEKKIATLGRLPRLVRRFPKTVCLVPSIDT